MDEAESVAAIVKPGPGQLGALQRLRSEFSEALAGSASGKPRRRKPMDVAVPGLADAFVQGDGFSGLLADRDTQRLSVGGVVNNRPGDVFAFYEKFEFTAWRPPILEESIVRDSAGRHIPGKRVLPWRNRVTLETELAYLAFKIPWLRLELGRDEFVWGPGYSGSVMLSDAAAALDHLQLSASYQNFKFLSFVSLLSRWGLKQRLLAGQRLELSFAQRLTLGGAMLAVSSWDEYQPSQLGGLLNPLIPLYFTEANSGHEGNFLVGWDAVLYLPRTKLYAQLFLDNYEFNARRSAPNATASQMGLYWAPNLPVAWRLEYTRIMPFTYYNHIHSLLYDNYGASLGHPLGPDADQALLVTSLIPSAKLQFNLAADFTRRGYHNRGDYRRKSYKNPDDTLYLRHHTEFPSRGWDVSAEPDTVIEEVDKTWRLGPTMELYVLQDLYLSVALWFWSSQNHKGVIGQNKTGLDFGLKVEYRY